MSSVGCDAWLDIFVDVEKDLLGGDRGRGV